MSLSCPECQTERADQAPNCVHCGVPIQKPSTTTVTPSETTPIPEEAPIPIFSFAQPVSVLPINNQEVLPEPQPVEISGHRDDNIKRSPGSLPWKAAVLLAILVTVILFRQTVLQTKTHQFAATPPAAVPEQVARAVPALTASQALPVLPSIVPAMAPVLSRTLPSHPFAVTLQSSSNGEPLTVGQPLLVSAQTTLSPGRSAILTMFYQHQNRHRTLLAQAQGNLCRAVWTPLLPGHYVLIATARDSQRQVSVAPPLTLLVIASHSAAQVPAFPKSYIRPRKALKAKKDKHTGRHRAIKLSLPPRPVRIPDFIPRFQVAPSQFQTVQFHITPSRFHVAAASFPFKHNATVLATALHNHGFPAVVRQQKNWRGKPAYVVQAGVFSTAAAAARQSQKLQHDGYPAFTYPGH